MVVTTLLGVVVFCVCLMCNFKVIFSFWFCVVSV